jgi:PAS domain S-box-containing protein
MDLDRMLNRPDVPDDVKAEIRREIVERKQAEMTLQTSNDFLDNILNVTGDPIFVKDASFRFVLVNNALCTMLGIERENILGKTLGESLPEDQMRHFLEVDRMVLASGQEYRCEEQLTGYAGKILTIVTNKTRYVNPQGDKLLVGVIHDITERKNMEHELDVAKEKAEQLRNILNQYSYKYYVLDQSMVDLQVRLLY